MKKDKFKKPAGRLDREIEWLKRDRPDYYAQGIKRLENGEPVDYVIGWREFLGCKIDLSVKPLIPREETEFWVGEAIKEVLRDRFSCTCPSEPWRSGDEMGSRKTEATCEVAFSSTKNDFSPSLRVLDLFSGSGCIGLAILKHCPNTYVTFAEKDPKLCEQIKKNLKLNKISANRAKVIQSDIFRQKTLILRNPTSQSLQKSGKLGRFDVIFANPPYIPTQKSKVQKSVKDWEPKSALYAGEDGLAIIKKFLKQAKDHLNPACPEQGRRSKIYLEFGFGQKLAIARLLKQFGYAHYQFNKDQFGKYRWVVIELK